MVDTLPQEEEINFAPEGLDITASPNPFTYELTVESPTELASIYLLGATGEVILQKDQIQITRSVLETGQLTPGIYYLQIIDQNGQRTMKKVIHQ